LYAARSGYSAFQGAADQAGLSQELDISIPDITVFVPINDAFNAIGSIVSSVDKATLTSVLQYHVIPNTIAYSNQLGNVTVPTLEGSDLTISVTDDAIFVNQAKVLFANVLIPNGVAHVIDRLVPPSLAASSRELSLTKIVFSTQQTALLTGAILTLSQVSQQPLESHTMVQLQHRPWSSP
jgi:hypothetical protein